MLTHTSYDSPFKVYDSVVLVYSQMCATMAMINSRTFHYPKKDALGGTSLMVSGEDSALPLQGTGSISGQGTRSHNLSGEVKKKK